MKQFTLVMISVLFISFSNAQTPSEKLFKKYGDKKGVELSVVTQPPVKDSARNTTITSVIKTMTISSDGGESTSAELFMSATKDFVRLLNSKGYTLIHLEKDEEDTVKVCRYTKKDIVEMCVLEISNEEVILTSTQIKGLSKEAMKEVKFEYTNK